MIDLKIITADSIESVLMFIPAVIGATTAPFFVKFLNQKISKA